MDLGVVSEYCVPFPAVHIHRTEAEDRRFVDYLCPLSEWMGNGPAVALLGVPSDEGVRRNGGRPGAAGSPAAIYAALARLAASRGTAMLPASFSLVDCGMMRTEGLSLEHIHARQQQIVTALLGAGLRVLVLGGGHDTALPNARALASCSKRLGVVNVDAHLDVRVPTAEGSHSGSPFRELIEDETVSLHRIVELGTQSFAASAHHVRFLLERGHVVWTLDTIRTVSLEHVLGAIATELAECDGIHLSLDMDAIASAYAPGVSAPASDGFSPADCAQIIERIVALPACRVVDIVELNPLYDVDNRTARLAAYFAALVIWTFLHRAEQCH